MSKECLVCKAKENLSAMSVSVDGLEHKIAICSLHEETPISKIKELTRTRVSESAGKLDALKKLADEMGFTLVPKSRIPAPIANPSQPSTSAAPATAPAPAAPKQKVVNAGQFKKTVEREKPPVQAPEQEGGYESVSGEAISKFNSYKIDGDLRGAKELQTITRTDGMPITVPKSIDDKTGHTDIKIATNITDADIQKRMKDPNQSFKDGYTVRSCALCSGSGVTKVGKKVCPKCGGGGMAKT